jgi:hypothetical protein
MGRTSRRVGPLLVAAVLLVAACTDDGGLSAQEQELADAFAADLSDGDDGFGVDADAGQCIGDAIMEELGEEPFEEAGVEPEDVEGEESPGELLGGGTVSDDTADVIVERWFDCVDMAATFAAEARDEFGLDDEGVACFEDALRDNGVLVRYLHVSFTSDSAEEAQAVLGSIVGLVQGCTAGEEGGGILVDSIAASLAEDGRLTPEQAQCVAQQVVDILGPERLIEVTGGSFETAPAEVQDEFAAAILQAATACGIPPAQLGG